MKTLDLGRAVLPDFHFERRGGAKIWINQKYHSEELLELIADCDGLLARPDCHIIKDQKKIKVGRIPLPLKDGELAVYIKRYNVFSLRHRIATLLWSSGAVRSLRGAILLRSAGIPTATAIAAVEVRDKGLLRGSFFVTEEISGGKTADSYWREDLAGPGCVELWRRRREFLTGLAVLFRSLHAAGVYHNDLKDANIIVAPHCNGASQAFCLLDLEGVRRYGRLSERRRIKNLVQINRTLGPYVRKTDKAYFIGWYLAGEITSPGETRRLIRRILGESRRLDGTKGTKPVRIPNAETANQR